MFKLEKENLWGFIWNNFSSKNQQLFFCLSLESPPQRDMGYKGSQMCGVSSPSPLIFIHRPLSSYTHSDSFISSGWNRLPQYRRYLLSPVYFSSNWSKYVLLSVKTFVSNVPTFVNYPCATVEHVAFIWPHVATSRPMLATILDQSVGMVWPGLTNHNSLYW